MKITLTREEAQQVLDALNKVFDHNDWRSWETAIELLRARLAKKEFVVPPIDGDTTPWVRSDEGW